VIARHLASAAVLLAVLAGAGCAARAPLLEPLTAAGLPGSVDLDGTPFHPQERYQCGPAALATVLSASGATVTPEALVAEVYLPGRQGSLQPELLASTRRHGRVPYVLPPASDALFATVAAGVPVLLLQKLGAGPFPGWHCAVLVGYDAGRERVLLRSGTTRRKAMSARHFLATWDRGGRWAMVALRPGDLPPVPDFANYMTAAAGLEAVGRAEDARLAYEAAMRAWPDQSLPQLALANLAYARGDLAGAERGFRTAAGLDPADAAARNNRAEVLRQLGCATAARREVERARALAAGGPLEVTVAATARQVAAMPPGDAPGCPVD
jgi:hypothetical protein